MDYRIKYRDIPWSVALYVLPAKIVGTLVGKPIDFLKREDALLKIARGFVIFLLAIAVAICAFLAVDLLFDKKFSQAIHEASEARKALEHIEAQQRVMETVKAIKAAECKYRDANGRCR